MLLIPCPWCGPRDEVEFRYGGQAHVAYPRDPEAMSDAEWADYLFMRDNPKGEFAERWCHVHGCRRWFNAIRDTVTHRFRVVYRMGDPHPEGTGGAPAPAGGPADPSGPPSRAPAPADGKRGEG